MTKIKTNDRKQIINRMSKLQAHVLEYPQDKSAILALQKLNKRLKKLDARNETTIKARWSDRY